MRKDFNIIEQDEDGFSSLPSRNCAAVIRRHKLLEVLMKRIKEAIELCGSWRFTI